MNSLASLGLPGLKQVLKMPRAMGVRRSLLDIRKSAKSVGDVSSAWRTRIDDVKSCPDNRHITRVDQAGRLDGAFIHMHNGVRVCARGYYGSGILNMLIENAGVHEPQEERAFTEVIDHLPAKPVMLELGAYWAFYSLSLLEARPDAQCHLVEPCPVRLESGRINFQANQRRGNFELAYVSDSDRWSCLHGRTVSVDGYCHSKSLSHLDILHADIQGHELAMLAGATSMMSRRAIDFVFISTHSNPLHDGCIRFLVDHDYEVLASANIDETYSFDGLIVAKRSELQTAARIAISKKTVPPAARQAA